MCETFSSRAPCAQRNKEILFVCQRKCKYTLKLYQALFNDSQITYMIESVTRVGRMSSAQQRQMCRFLDRSSPEEVEQGDP